MHLLSSGLPSYRIAIAKGVVAHGLELMMALFRIAQGVISTIMDTGGFPGTPPHRILKNSFLCFGTAPRQRWIRAEGQSPYKDIGGYIGELIFNMLVLVGAIKMADRVVREMMGL